MNSKPLTILLVEDDDIHALLVYRSLQNAPFSPHIHRVANGQDAIEFLRQHGKFANSPVPDVVLLDLRLPKATGHDVLIAIKSDENLRSIPVVVMTTSSDETDRAKAYRQHANSYVVKPADFDKFRQVVMDVSHYWGVCNERPVA